jgi:hypothetical protein
MRLCIGLWLFAGLACESDEPTPAVDGTAIDSLAGDTAVPSPDSGGNDAVHDSGQSGDDAAADTGNDPADAAGGDTTEALDGATDGAGAKIDCAALDCEDGDGCTVDACDPAEGCVYFFVTCVDEDPCTIDSCDPGAGCMFEPYSCDDGEECTEDICYGNGLCKNFAPECDDGNACTVDGCAEGTCAYTPVVCDDGDPCTIDTCREDAGCDVETAISACCATDADCDDKFDCTAELCVGGQCVYTVAIPGACCVGDSDCSVQSSCQAATCVDQQCLVVTVEGPGCCTVAEQCDDGDACTVDSCVDNTCSHLNTCCVEDLDCSDGDDVCTEDRCESGGCGYLGTGAQGCCTGTLFETSFEGGNLEGFSIENEVQITGVGWKALPSAKAVEGIWVLYYGNPLTLDYFTGSDPNAGVATTPAVELPPGVESELSFQLYMDTELGTYSDRLLIRVVEIVNGTPVAKKNLVWTKKGFFLAKQWVKVSIDLTMWMGKTIQVEFDFDTFDGAIAGKEGILIDQLRFLSSCTSRTCTVTADCDDGLLYTTETCKGGLCFYEESALNCEQNSDCVDDNPCTSDVCGDYQCFNVPQAWCCADDGECLDTFACTVDTCIANIATPFCSHTWKPNCCDVTADGAPLFCDDSDPCTADTCPVPGQPCVHTPLEGCCENSESCDDAEACTVDLCVAGTCTHYDMCCSTDDECNDADDECTAEACMGGQCSYIYTPKPDCCVTTVLTEAFEGAAAAQTFSQVGAAAAGAASWGPSSANSFGGNASIWFGNPATGNYVSGATTPKGTLRTKTPLVLPILTFTRLSFAAYLGVEYAYGDYTNPEFDRLIAKVQPLSPLTLKEEGPPVVLWDSAWGSPQWWHEGPQGKPTGPKWTTIDGLDLTPWAGKFVHLSFEFDAKDTFNNAYDGVYLDDIRVERTCGIAAPAPK